MPWQFIIIQTFERPCDYAVYWQSNLSTNYKHLRSSLPEFLLSVSVVLHRFYGHELLSHKNFKISMTKSKTWQNLENSRVPQYKGRNRFSLVTLNCLRHSQIRNYQTILPLKRKIRKVHNCCLCFLNGTPP